MTAEDADRGRAAVAAAETAAFTGTDLETVVSYAVACAAAERVVTTAWWPGPEVVLRAARAGAQSSSARTGPEGSVEVRLAADQMTVTTVAHELAHALAGVERGHDAVFRCAYLDVVTVITNTDSRDRRGALHHSQLADAFDAVGLVVGERRWGEPVGFGAAIAL